MKPKAQTEKSIMLGIMQALGFKGWRIFRMPPSIYGKKGLADLCCTRWGVTVWIEVKRETGQLSEAQKKFGQEVSDAGGIYIVAKSVEFAVRCCESVVIYLDGISLAPKKGMQLKIPAIKEAPS